jgi:hypothetical protein
MLLIYFKANIFVRKILKDLEMQSIDYRALCHIFHQQIPSME